MSRVVCSICKRDLGPIDTEHDSHGLCHWADHPECGAKFFGMSVAEHLTGTIESSHSTLAMERGTNLEPQARDWYRFETGFDVQQVGFVYTDEQKASGCSPDGLCADRGVEIKCPLRKNSVAFVMHMRRTGRVPTDHFAQVQFQMWVCGLSIYDFCVFNPENAMPSAIVTVEKDEAYHNMLDVCIPDACEEIKAAVDILRGE